MVSIKIVRRKNKERKDGTAPLALRLSKNYKTNYFFTGQYILEKDWDSERNKVKKTHPNYKRINNFLMKKIVEANDISFEKDNKISSKELKRKIVGHNNQKSFFELAANRIENKFNNGTYSVAKSELSILYNLEEFLNYKKSLPKEEVIINISKRRKKRISKARKNEYSFKDGINHFKKSNQLEFQDINQSFIIRFKTFCSAYLLQKTRTITNQLIFIRTVFNIALKNNLIDNTIYPFSNKKERIRIKSSSAKFGHSIPLTSDESDPVLPDQIEHSVPA